MRRAIWVALCAGALALASCESERPTADPAPAQERDPRFSFGATADLLEGRRIFLRPLEETEGVLSSSEFAGVLKARMERHSAWEVLSIHLAEMDMTDPHFNIYDQPTYVVEITGPRTGNCFEFYLASDGNYEGGACFYPTRS